MVTDGVKVGKKNLKNDVIVRVGTEDQSFGHRI